MPEGLEGKTVIAKMYFSTNFLGYFWHPSAEISFPNQTLRHYTEYGAKGFRYVDLSQAVGQKQVLFKGKRLNIPDQEVEIFVYQNPQTENKKILILAPHPDDAEIAAYGFYQAHAQNVFILTISPGENGSFHYKELYDKKTEYQQQVRRKGELRTLNSITVPLMAGVKPDQMLSLGYFNETLEQMYQNPQTEIPSKRLHTTDVSVFRKWNIHPLAQKLEMGSNWGAFKANLQRILQEFSPDIVVTPSTQIDTHPDHKYTTLGLLEVLQHSSLNPTLLLYTNHYTYDYYPYGRMGGTMPLPPSFDKSIIFDSIYSFPLGKEQQREKILAFDAMNDLRPNTDYRLWQRLFARAFTSLRARCFSIEKDYFNMYVRSNELFYVISTQNALEKLLNPLKKE